VRISVGIAVLLALLVAAPAAVALPPNPAACTVTISLDQTIVDVKTSPTEATEAVATAHVTVDKPNGLDVTLTLDTRTDQGWAASVSPGTWVMDGVGRSGSVLVQITVPPGEPVGASARVTLTVEVDSGYYPCQGASSSDLTVRVAPIVERFAGYIIPESLNVSDDARRVEFRVEIEAVANAAVRVTIEYHAEAGVEVVALRSLTLNPQVGGADNATIEVVLRARYLPPGPYEFAMDVYGDVEGHPQMHGDLGMTIYIPRSTEEASPIDTIVEAGGIVAIAVAVAVAVAWGVIRRARR
jgi:hypothetical protein